MERHIQTLITTILAGLCAWVGLNVVELKQEVATLNATMSFVQEFRNNTYSKSETDSKFIEKETRIKSLENEVKLLRERR